MRSKSDHCGVFLIRQININIKCTRNQKSVVMEGHRSFFASLLSSLRYQRDKISREVKIFWLLLAFSNRAIHALLRGSLMSWSQVSGLRATAQDVYGRVKPGFLPNTIIILGVVLDKPFHLHRPCVQSNRDPQTLLG